jgi:protein gp37
MGNVFEDRKELKPLREKLWALIEATPSLDWQLLTIRPENILSMLPRSWLEEPRPNVWIGATVEMAKYAARRIPKLLEVPATTRFLSVEPLLEPIDLGPFLGDGRIHWVIIGGETGSGARPMHVAWVRQIIAQCHAAAVPCFVKSLGQTWARANDFLEGSDQRRRPVGMAERRVCP